MLLALDPVSVWPLSTLPLGAPVVATLTPEPATDNSPEFYYDSIGDRASWVSGSEPGAANCLTDTTDDEWSVSSEYAEIVINLLSPEQVDFIAIAQHNLSVGASVIAVEYWSGAWVEAGAKTISSTLTDIHTFAPVTASAYRIKIWSQVAGLYPSLGVIKLGKKLAAERKIYSDHAPAQLNEVIRLYNRSNGGNGYSGQIQEVRSYETSIDISNLTPDWVRNDARLLRRHISGGRPFFFRWRPTKYPQDLIYCWASGDISASNAGPVDKMNWSVSVEALA